MRELPSAQAIPPVETRTGNRRLTITLYAIVAYLYWAGLYLYVPTLPTYVKSKTDSFALVGIVLSMYGLLQAIIRLPLGIAADWLGRRKPFIVAGLALLGLGAWILAAAGDAAGLALGRAPSLGKGGGDFARASPRGCGQGGDLQSQGGVER